MAASRSLVSWLTRARRASRSFAGASIGMPATESDSCSVVRHNLQPDSISRNSHDAAVGGVTSRACRRDQSMPSTNAASCADVSRIIPSAIGGHRNAPCSRRFQNSTRPEPSHATIFTRSAQLVSLYVPLSDSGQADHPIVLIINVVFWPTFDHALHRYAYCFRTQCVDRNQPLRALDCLCCRQDALQNQALC